MTVIVEIEAKDLDAASEVGREIWEKCSPIIRDVPGARWMLPIGDFKEREPFATKVEA